MDAEVKKWALNIVSRAMDCRQEGPCVFTAWAGHTGDFTIYIYPNGYVDSGESSLEKPERYQFYLRDDLANPAPALVAQLKELHKRIDNLFS